GRADGERARARAVADAEHAGALRARSVPRRAPREGARAAREEGAGAHARAARGSSPGAGEEPARRASAVAVVDQDGRSCGRTRARPQVTTPQSSAYTT